VNSAPQRRLREGAPTAEKARASAWGSLSQILAAPGKIVSPPPPSPLREEPKVCVSANTMRCPLSLSLQTLQNTLLVCQHDIKLMSGGLNPKALAWIPWEVKLPKARIVLDG